MLEQTGGGQRRLSRAHLLKRKAKLYRWMYEFSQNACTSCSQTGCACKDSICAHVEQEARKRGHEFPHTGHKLRFIGCAGCVVPPELRETCTLYICEPAMARPEFDRETYKRLMRAITLLEWRLMECEEAARPPAPEDPARTFHKTAFQTS